MCHDIIFCILIPKLRALFKQDLIDMTLKKMDLDKDGRVSYSDFEETVKREPLMMEAFGPCLPNNKIGFEFMQQFLDSRPNNSIYHE